MGLDAACTVRIPARLALGRREHHHELRLGERQLRDGALQVAPLHHLEEVERLAPGPVIRDGFGRLAAVDHDRLGRRSGLCLRRRRRAEQPRSHRRRRRHDTDRQAYRHRDGPRTRHGEMLLGCRVNRRVPCGRFGPKGERLAGARERRAGRMCSLRGLRARPARWGPLTSLRSPVANARPGRPHCEFVRFCAENRTDVARRESAAAQKLQRAAGPRSQNLRSGIRSRPDPSSPDPSRRPAGGRSTPVRSGGLRSRGRRRSCHPRSSS
jgi:hypothetical protein